MKLLTGLLLAALPVLTAVAAEEISAGAAVQIEAEANLFREVLSESGLRLDSPDGFTAIALEPNPVLHYEHARRHESGNLEVRYIIRPLGRITIDYEDPHNAAPEPNHLFPMLFESLIVSLSGDGDTPRSEYPVEQARELFNADWAAAAVFDLNPEFTRRYSQALLLAIHKDNRADAYTLFLFDDYDVARDRVQEALSALAFK